MPVIPLFPSGWMCSAIHQLITVMFEPMAQSLTVQLEYNIAPHSTPFSPTYMQRGQRWQAGVLRLAPQKPQWVFGSIAHYFLIMHYSDFGTELKDRNVLSLSSLWCKHMWVEAQYRTKLHLDCTTKTAWSARRAKITIRLPKRGNVPDMAAFKTWIRQTTQLKLLTILNPAEPFSHPVHTT